MSRDVEATRSYLKRYTAMISFQYAAALKPDPDGGFVVTFRDLPEAITQGDTLEQGLAEAEDALDEAIANRIKINAEIPAPTPPRPGEHVIFVPASTATKAAFYNSIRRLKMSKVELAATLGVDEREVRRLLDPYHPSKLNRIEELMRLLGTRIVVHLQYDRSSVLEGTVADLSKDILTGDELCNAKPKNQKNLHGLDRDSRHRRKRTPVLKPGEIAS